MLRLLSLAAVALLILIGKPVLATSVFERETIYLTPNPDEASFHERLNPLVEALSDAGGGTIKLGPGVYTTTQQLYILSNIKLSGSGRDEGSATVIRLADQAPPFGNKAGIIRAKDNRIGRELFVRNVVIEDLVIDGNRDNQRQDVYDAEKKYGFYAEAIDLLIQRVTIHSCMGYGFDPHGGINNEPSTRVVIQDTHAYNNLKDGYALDRQVDMTFRNNLAEDNDRAGINVVTTSVGLVIENSIARNNGGDGIVIQNGSGRIAVRDNEVYGNERHGLYIRDAWEIALETNEVRGNALSGVRVLGGLGIDVSRNLILENSADQSVGHYEVQVEPYQGRKPRDVNVSDNRIQATRVGAVSVEGDGSGVVIQDNVFQTLRSGITAAGSGAIVANNLQMSF